MGRTQVFNGLELVIPDAYSALDVSRLLTPTSGGVGIVALVGEADGGKPGLHIFPGGASPQVVKDELKSGPLADMVRLALRSGSDNLVQGGASTVVAYKTNNSTQSTLNVGSPAKLVLTTKQYGLFTKSYTADIASSSGKKFLTVRDEKGVPEVSVGVGSEVFASLLYTGNGTAATMTLHYVSGTLTLTTTLTGASDGSVSQAIDCTTLTLGQLKSLFSALVGYTFTVTQGYEQVKVSDLDLVISAVSILTKVDFKASIYELIQWGKNQSLLVTVARGAGDDGDAVPSTSATAMFTGGTRGSTSNSTVQTAMNALLDLRINIVVPLFSKDSQDGSTVTIAAVNAQVKDHVQSRSAILGKSECQSYVSVQGNKQAFIDMVAAMNSRWMAVTSQKVRDLDIDGNEKVFDEYAFAVVCAQTQAGSPIGTDLTYRTLPILGLTQDASWNPSRDGQELIKKGCLIAGPDENNTLRVIAGYTSWLQDDNNANIYIETVESLAIFAFNHRKFMKQRFLGQSSFSRQDVLDAIKQSLEVERDTTKSIKGFDLDLVKIKSVTAGRLEYDVAVVPFEGVKFVLPTVVAIRES